MRAVYLGAVAPLAILAAPAWAGDAVVFADAPEWVVPADFDAAVEEDEEIVLFDRQLRLEDGVVRRFTDIAYAVRNSEILSQLGTLQFGWLPDKGDLAVHRIEIVRDGKVIDLLADGIGHEVIRRETELERRTVNGALTALFKIPGLKVGDILRFSSTTTNRDQALAGAMQATEGLTPKPTRLGYGRLRMSWPQDSGVSYAMLGQAPEPSVSDAKGYRTVELILPIEKLEEMPEDAPARFKVPPALMAGSFATWGDVAAVMAPHYAVENTIEPGSTLAKEVDRIRAATPDPLERAALALRTVQDEINYLLNGMDGGNYLPQSPMETWALGYGDCKAKSVLLLAILHKLDIEAEAMLVNSKNGDAVQQWKPLPGAFDHVVVRATIDGTEYWLDGTSAGSRLATIREVPNFGYALPLRASGADLVKLEQRWPGYADRTMRVTYDLSRGVDLPAVYDLDVETRGVLAARMEAQASATDPKEVLGHAQKFTDDLFDGFVYEASYSYDPESGIGHLRAKGVLSEAFALDRDIATHKIYTATTNWSFDPDRARAAWRDIPYRVTGPMTSVEEATYRLPDDGKGATISGSGDLAERMVAGTRFERSLTFDDGVVRVTDSASYIPGEIAAADIPATKAAMRAMNSADPEIRISAPRRVWELSDKEVAQRVKGLIAPANNLVDLWPDEGNFLMLRSALKTLGRDYPGALVDIDKAIALEGSAAAYTGRADILTRMGRFDDAVAATRTAFELTGDLSDATAYAHALALDGRAEEGLELLDSIDVSGEDRSTVAQIFAEIAGTTDRSDEGWAMLAEALSERPGDDALLNSQCWFVGTWNYHLDDGAELCDRAVKAASYSAAALDSRALVFHRLGREEEALADLDAALKKEPAQAASRYLRGIIRLGRGESEGRTDILEALRLAPDIAARYERYGISPAR
ncbi:DUF3857 domain-containing protein [Qipengyuania sp. YG27]|uniref:DUF3857 domain-containing protein n=1 Tax=Qipengyuania mesophila TaxID=2867246 RepID=A0ABS7JQS2_9SPHN|nr:DUF3857 domain-containing protein [Qipengyuania mesophila]MBX7499991.1 DUF3857 domain-containing protein [Qipengyuania mesophila]